MKLGILGGTFDPVHTGHLLLAEVTCDQLGLERVLFVPAGDPPHKRDQPKTEAEQRRAMVVAAIADNPRFDLSTVDMERPGPHYSVDTVRLIRQQYHLVAEDTCFIVGSDSLADLATWHQPARLVSHCRLAVVHRPGITPDTTHLEQDIPGLTEALVWVPAPLLALAASNIRARVAAGQSIRYQVPPPVLAYIQQHGLYTEPRVTSDAYSVFA
jgi:nicotinate-nucleotide adenylyltransferase